MGCRRRGDHATFKAFAARLRGALALEMDAESGTATGGLLETGTHGLSSSGLLPVVGGSPADSDIWGSIGTVTGPLSCTSGLEGDADTVVQLPHDLDVQNAMRAFVKSKFLFVLHSAAQLLSAFAKSFDAGSVFLTTRV